MLERIPGLTVVEPAEQDLCCGSAGIYNVTQPEAARELGDRKAANVLATAPDVYASANPGLPRAGLTGARAGGQAAPRAAPGRAARRLAPRARRVPTARSRAPLTGLGDGRGRPELVEPVDVAKVGEEPRPRDRDADREHAADHDGRHRADERRRDARLEGAELVRGADEDHLDGVDPAAQLVGRHEREDRLAEHDAHHVDAAARREREEREPHRLREPEHDHRDAVERRPRSAASRPARRRTGRRDSTTAATERADGRRGAEDAEPGRADLEHVAGEDRQERDRAAEEDGEEVERDRAEEHRRPPDEQDAAEDAPRGPGEPVPTPSRPDRSARIATRATSENPVATA